MAETRRSYHSAIAETAELQADPPLREDRNGLTIALDSQRLAYRRCPVSKHIEERLAGTGPAVRVSAQETTEIEILRQIFARLDPVALGASLAVVCGSMLLLATTVLVLKGGRQVGIHLGLLSEYLPGYRVTPAGSLVGACYAAAGGFLLGWFAAHLRNAFLSIYLWMVRFWANLSQSYFLDRFD